MQNSLNIGRFVYVPQLLARCVLLLFLLPGFWLPAANVTLGWDPSYDTNVVGYNVYYGVASHDYPYKLDAGSATSVTISNLVGGLTYYVAGTAYDSAGNESAFSDEMSFTMPGAPAANPSFTLMKSGEGSFWPDLSKRVLKPGQTYSVTAVPGRGQVFAGWVGSITSASPRLTFTFTNTLLLEAIFIPSPFLQASGLYSGLFAEPDQVRQQSAGFFSTVVTSRGAFSGRLLLGSRRFGFSGKLDAQSQATKLLRHDTVSLSLQLTLAPTNQPPTASGQLTDGSWTALLSGSRFTFDAKTNPAPFTGNYTLVIPGQAGSSAVPAGAGFGIARITRSGRATLVGTLADGIRFSQSTMISADGLWPLYASLYAGNGLAWSWLSCTNPSPSELQGQFTWLKSANPQALCYPDGFAFQAQAVGSRYQAPSTRSGTAFDLNNALLSFSDGSLSAGFTNTLAAGPSEPTVGTANGVRLEISRSTGSFRGVVNLPGSDHTMTFRGAVLQNLAFGCGFLVNAGQSSLVTLTPAAQ